MAIPILTDTDHHSTQAQTIRIEPVDTLPTGLAQDKIGRTVTYDGKLHVFDGSQFNTWEDYRRQWYTIYDDPLANNETDEWIVRTARLDNYSDNISFFVGSAFKTNGLITYIGGLEFGEVDWNDAAKSRYIHITAAAGGWFNIKNNANDDPAPDNAKNIITGIGKDLEFLRKAVIVYDPAGSGNWLVKSFSHIQWDRTYAIPGSGSPELDKHQFDIEVPSAGVPVPGRYYIHANVTVSEVTFGTPPTAASTQNSQTFYVEDNYGGSSSIECFKSINCAGGTGDPKVYNTFMEGGGIMEITGPNRVDRKFKCKIYLPNGNWNTVSGGTLHVILLPDKKSSSED